MTTDAYTLRFAGTPATFEQAAAHLRAALDGLGVHGRARGRVELVFEEIVTNVIRHGDANAAPHRIDVSMTRDDQAVVLTFDDDGRPFDPLQQPIADRPASIKEVRLGGLGILLVRKASASLRYERTADDRNRLTATIAL